MERFYVNKHPINYGAIQEGEPLLIPTGTIFSISAMLCSGFELTPLQKIKDLEYPLIFDALMIEKGFTAQNHINLEQ